MATIDGLLYDIYDGKKPALYRESEGCLRDSRRFKKFAINYRSKIRAKPKNVR